MTIELAIFLAERFGYKISIDKVSLDAILLGFKNYDVIVGVSCFVLAYFGTRAVSWLLPNAISYTRYWNSWHFDNKFKEKMNKNLDDPNEFESWRVNHEKRFNDAKIYTEKFKLILLFCGNLFLTYHFIVQTYLLSLYIVIVDLVLFMAMVIIGLTYTFFKDELIFSLFMAAYFDDKVKFEIKDARKIDRYGIRALHWVVNIIFIGAISAVFAIAFSKSS
jgi:hypothetical protein